jgi:predicted ATPase with chaperone activity
VAVCQYSCLDPPHECSCSLGMVQRYQKRISGPLMDRFDIHIEVPRVDYEKLTSDRLGEPSEQIRTRVEAARAVQRERFRGTKMACRRSRRGQRGHGPGGGTRALRSRRCRQVAAAGGDAGPPEWVRR